jgi:hypothetical protein
VESTPYIVMELLRGADLDALLHHSKPLTLSADHGSVLYTWSPTSASMNVFEGATAASLTSSTQMGSMVFGQQRTAVPEIAPRGSEGLVVKGPSGPSVLRITWGE